MPSSPNVRCKVVGGDSFNSPTIGTASSSHPGRDASLMTVSKTKVRHPHAKICKGICRLQLLMKCVWFPAKSLILALLATSCF